MSVPIHAIHTHLHGRIPAGGAPAPRCGAPAFLATTLRDGAIFAHFVVGLLCNIDILLQSFS